MALCLFAAAPAFAQPAPKQPAPAPQQPAPAPKAGAATPTPDDMATFEKDLNALFVPGGLTAEQAAARASKVSPTVQRRVAEVQAAIAQAEAASLARVPQIGGKASYTKLSPLDPISFGPGFPPLQFPDRQYLAEGSVGVPLSDYLLRFPKLNQAARLGVDVAKTNQVASEVNAGQDARLAYYEWLRAKLQVLVAERQHAQVLTVLKQVRALAEAQRLSKADLMRVESQEADAERTADVLRYLAALREEQLRILIGAKPEEKLEIGDDARGEVTGPAPGTLDDMVSKATHNRLEFHAIDLGILAKEAARDSQKANAYPHLSAFASADYANPNPRIFPQEKKWDFTWAAGVQISWTINDTLIERTNQDRLRAEIDELRADRENLLRGTRLEVLQAQQAVQLAQLGYATSQKGLAAAEEGYRVRRELLNADRATAVELVDAETDLTRSRVQAINARVDLRVAMIQLKHALGEDAPQPVHR